ncbi:PREDICTED: uncharacterized protein LOC107351016 isoform X1 [Acropora digitifera]|uniref:uncharacterized protein LOC107351016 isoform X1 n=1 Tax=Acropora digitifera TaxID=70779 RepID=UPI00077A3BF2|nr:PREDICTED: uncharacterized protein LOC107351016 isoform X1 [Acropora digitifera]
MQSKRRWQKYSTFFCFYGQKYSTFFRFYGVILFGAFVSVEKKFPIGFGQMTNKIGGMSLLLWLSATLILKISHTTATQQHCQGEYSVSGMFLRGHTFKKVAVDFPSKCDLLCSQDIRCQSYNVIIGRHICELNNRTKEARPGDFLLDSQRFYMRRAINRVPLGSIPELPAKSCAEIKASEGKAMADSNHWIYSNGDDAIHATCRG